MSYSVSTSKERIDALTGLRFIAALFVYLSHQPRPDYLPEWLGIFFQAGYCGVTIFFVLSGFVIGLNYFDSIIKRSWQAILRYGIARLARVYPLYLIVLIFVWWSNGAPLDGNALLHFLALQAWVPNLELAYAFNGPGWSIGVEFFLYACFPLLVLMLEQFQSRLKTLWLLAFFIICLMVGIGVFFDLSGLGKLSWEHPNSAHYWLYQMPLTRLGDFSLGVIASLIFKNQALSQSSKYVWSLTSYCAFLGTIALMLYPAHLFSVFSWDTSFAISAFFVILGLAYTPQTFLAQLLGSRLLVVLGEASFALYLIHVPWMNIWGTNYYTKLDPVIAIFLWTAFTLMSLTFSLGLHTYIEAPLRRVITKLTEKQFGISKHKILIIDSIGKKLIFPAGLLLFVFASVSVPRWFVEIVPFLSTLGQGASAPNRYTTFPIQVQFSNGIELIEYGPEQLTRSQGGNAFHLFIKWACHETMTGNYKIQIELRDVQDRVWAKGKANYQDSSSLCVKQLRPANDQILDFVEFSLPVTMPAGAYRVVVSLYDQAKQDFVIAFDNSGKILDNQLQITTWAIAKNHGAFTAGDFFIENRFFVDMREIRLLGYTALPDQVRLGDELDVGLYWRARGKPQGDYLVTVQLRDSMNNVALEQSARPAENTYPTTEWQTGEVLLDWHRISIPQSLPGGEYQIAVVLKDPSQKQIVGERAFFTILLVQ